MKELIKTLLKPIALFFVWQYKQVDKLRPDDTPFQVLILYITMMLGEAWMFYAFYLFFE